LTCLLKWDWTPDHPRALGEVGRVGVAIDSLADMDVLLDGIPLDQVSTSMTINATASTLLVLYQLAAEKRGISPAALSGTVQNDILKEYAARGTYIYPPAPSMRLVTDLMDYAHHHLPNWNTISISGYPSARPAPPPPRRSPLRSRMPQRMRLPRLMPA
jgi:methylmalonyl-CoA mutase N-terminal domain/subunit